MSKIVKALESMKILNYYNMRCEIINKITRRH